MKSPWAAPCKNMLVVAPARGRGLKSWMELQSNLVKFVAPARGRGLKFDRMWWHSSTIIVAPARGRGLKLVGS